MLQLYRIPGPEHPDSCVTENWGVTVLPLATGHPDSCSLTPEGDTTPLRKPRSVIQPAAPAMSWLGGTPNLRAYSRLNWLALSYPTS